MANIGIIGAGTWGTALAIHLAKCCHHVTVWSHEEKEAALLSKNRKHPNLPDAKIPAAIRFTACEEEVCADKSLLLFSVPSIFTRETARRMAPYVPEGQRIVNVAKGIEETTLLTQSELTEQELPRMEVCVLSGPSHAEEVSIGMPTAVVAGAKRRETAEYIQNTFMSPAFRVYSSPDIKGIELGGSLKNVIALAAGMADGLGYGDNTEAALVTRGMTEMGRLVSAMGCSMQTVYGLAGLGDLIVTCGSRHSRNRRAGVLIGQGYTAKAAMKEVQMVVEGVYSAKAAKQLAEKYQVEMPIVEEVNRILFEGKPAADAVMELMCRDKTSEHPGLSW